MELKEEDVKHETKDAVSMDNGEKKDQRAAEIDKTEDNKKFLENNSSDTNSGHH